MDFPLKPIASLCKILSDENRLRLLLAMRSEKKSVSQLVEELGLSQPLVSHHLKELRYRHLVKAERNGPFVYYELASQSIINMLSEFDSLVGELMDNLEPF
jgi:DNA-binding transcriptional ArsR family regulator